MSLLEAIDGAVWTDCAAEATPKQIQILRDRGLEFRHPSDSFESVEVCLHGLTLIVEGGTAENAPNKVLEPDETGQLIEVTQIPGRPGAMRTALGMIWRYEAQTFLA